MNTKGLIQKMTPARLKIKILRAENMIDYYEKSRNKELKEYWQGLLRELKTLKCPALTVTKK